MTNESPVTKEGPEPLKHIFAGGMCYYAEQLNKTLSFG